MFQYASTDFKPRHMRLFELIRQQNLMNTRRRPSDSPLDAGVARTILRQAQQSVQPAPGWMKTAL